MPTNNRLLVFAAAGAAIVLAAGFAGGGYLAGRGVLLSRLNDRVVTVKGVAETETVANLTTYPLRYTVTASDLATGKRTLDEQAQRIVAFFKQQGFDDDEITIQHLEVQDSQAQYYRPESSGGPRFVLAQTVSVRSGKIDRVTAASRDIGKLVQDGIVLTSSMGPTYVVTADRLNAMKPDLIRRATAAARDAADEFARVSGSTVGEIRRANQGVIVILARDEAANAAEQQSVEKRIRAVTTVDYRLVR